MSDGIPESVTQQDRGARNHVRSDLGSAATPVTYFAVPMQQQFAANEQAVATKPYAGAFAHDPTVPLDWAKSIQDGPMSPDEANSPTEADLAALVANVDSYADSGYTVLEGPTGYVQSRMVMPGVTSEMMRWWFVWSPLESERYTLWFPQAHISNWVEDPDRIADTSLSFEERFYNNVNYVKEYIGSQALPIEIHFTTPSEIGLDEAALKAAGFTISASGYCCFGMAPEITTMLMVHLGRDTDQGMEWVSRYWIGTHPAMRRFPGGDKAAALFEKLGMDKDGLLNLAYELSVHDMTEYTNLARILPGLFARFSKEA